MKDWTYEQWQEGITAKKTFYLYVYAPMCGTCQVAKTMLTVIKTMQPYWVMGEANANYVQQLTQEQQIESVPCLVLVREGIVQEKLYAFHSVPHLLTKMQAIQTT